jgi:hypothetical protein
MRRITGVLLLTAFLFQLSIAQSQESPLRFFGYFQNSFVHEKAAESQKRRNSFSMQQLNLIAQKDISDQWTAFINFQAVNNFSSGKRWGAYSVEEAWLRYRKDNHFNLKLGLQIPIFNSFNEIKNRTPLVPYVTKPLVYEDSYSEVIAISDFVPQNTFVQAYGFHGKGSLKLDYAVYLGNSPNIETEEGHGISGLDTTDSFLFGTRLGLRWENIKFGVSFTSDQAAGINQSPSYFQQDSLINKLVHRIRFGADFSAEIGNFDLKAEVISVSYDENVPDLDLTKSFFYSTLGYHISDKWFAYFSAWYLQEKFLPNADLSFTVGTLGLSYMLNDRITFKIQTASVEFETKIFDSSLGVVPSDDFFNHGVAVSVFF